MKAITVGCDPEFAMYDANTGYGISAIGIIPGSKEAPAPVAGSKVGLKIQPDNVSIEFNIDPVDTVRFPKAVTTAMAELAGQVRKYAGPTASLYYGDSFEYLEKDLKAPSAIKLGCDPDQLAHARGEYRKPPRVKDMGNRRMFAGHIHVGYDKQSVDIPDWAIVQGLEALGYIPMMLSRGQDYQEYRRTFYGIPGLYRSKPYGFEYRTPSNQWCRNPVWAAEAVGIVQHIISKPNKFRDIWSSIDFDDVKNYIENNGESKNARAVVATMNELSQELMESPNESL